MIRAVCPEVVSRTERSVQQIRLVTVTSIVSITFVFLTQKLEPLGVHH